MPGLLPVELRQQPESGAAAVELALVLPVLMAIVLGILGFGRMFSTQIDLSNAVQEGARSAVFASTPPSIAAVKSTTVSASNLAPALTVGDVSVAGSCTTAGSTVTVTASRLISFDYVLGSLSRTITGQAAMRCPG